MFQTELKQAQQERNSVEALKEHRFFNLCVDLLCIAGFDGYFKHLNPAWETTLGYSTTELLELPFLELVHPEDREATEREVQKMSSGASVINFENRYLCKDGSYKWLSWTSAPFVEEGLIYAVARDVTERKQTEEALRWSEARWQRLAENLPGVIYQYCQYPDGTDEFIYVSPGIRDLLELEPATVCENSQLLWANVHPDDLSAFVASVSHSANTLNQWCMEWRSITPSGATKWLRGVARPERQPDATLIWDGILLDISNVYDELRLRKQAEAALQESEKRFRAIFEQAAVGIAQVSLSGQFLQVNQRCCDLLGYTESELWARTDQELIHPDDLNLTLDYQRQMLADEIPTYSHEKRYIRKDSQVQWVNSTVSLVRDFQGVPQYFIKVIEDIREHKQAQEALKQSEEKFRQMAQSIRECFWMSDAEMTQVLYVSPAYEDIWGRTCQSAYEQIDTWLDAVHPEDRQQLINSWERLYQGETIENEYRVIRPDGSIVWVLDRTFPVWNSQGEMYRLAGIIVDISDRKLTEEALKESEQKFRAIFDSTLDAILIADDDGYYVDANPAACALIGLSKEKIIGRHVLTITAPQQIQNLQNLWQSFLAQGQMRGEFSLHLTDGTTRDIEYTAKANFLPGRHLSVFRDITERKQSEEALYQSAATNRALLNGIPDMIFRCRADGTFVDYKPAQNFNTFVPPSVFLGKKVQEILPPEIAHRVMQTHEQAKLSGKTQIIEYQLPIDDQLHDYEARIVVKDQDEFIAIVRDITERKRTESALRQQKELLQTIFDHIPVMVAFYDATGQIQLINRELERVLGWSLAELRNRNLLALCYPNPKYRKRVLDFMRTATGKWQDFKTRTRNGRVLNTCWANVRLSDGSSIGIGSDVTERKRAEEALRALTQQERQRALQLEETLQELQRTQAQLVQNEKLASLGQLVAGVAHEINNPVSFIYCNVTPASDYVSNLLDLISLYQEHYPTPAADIQEEIEAIDLDFIKEDFPKLLRSMHEGATRIQEIVRSLHCFSHHNKAKIKKTDLHQGLDSTVMILQSRLKEQPYRAGIQVIKEYGDLPLVACYPGELNQVFMNLLSNAIDALEQKIREDASLIPQIRICTEVVRDNPNQPPVTKYQSTDKVVIRIADNGFGIPPHVQQHLFDPFFTTKPVGKGTGLGLSISHSIVVQKHNGELYCNSQFGQGTEFVIELPLR